MTTIFMTIANESMAVQFSQTTKENKVTVFSNLSVIHTNHKLELDEKQLRDLRNFLTIQIRKMNKK